MSNFSFAHSVFKRLVLQTHKKQGLFGKVVCQTITYSSALYPINRGQILDSSKLKDFADDNLKFEENCRKLFKPVENTVGKGEIARYEQFLLFPQCFQKFSACFPGHQKV